MNLKKILKNYIGILFLTFLSLLGSFLTNIFINFHYGKEIFGYYSTIYNITMFFSVFIAFGVGQFMLRELSVDKNKFIKSIYYLKKILLYTYIFSFLAYILFTILANYEVNLKMMILISLPVIFLLGAINLYSNIKLVEKKFMNATLISTSFHIVILLALICVYIFRLDFLSFIVILSFISLLLTLYMFIKINIFLRYISVTKDNSLLSERISFKNVFNSVWPFGVIGLMYFVYYQSDIILLSFYQDSNAVAEYNAAFSIMAALLVFPRILYQRLLAPFIYETWHKHKKENKIQKIQIYIIFTSILVYIFILLFSNHLIDFLFGESYIDASNILMILSISFVLRFIYGYSSVVMNFEENLNSKMRIMSITALINLILNFVFIPIYGVYGAAISTIFAELLLCILMLLKNTSIQRRI